MNRVDLAHGASQRAPQRAAALRQFGVAALARRLRDGRRDAAALAAVRRRQRGRAHAEQRRRVPQPDARLLLHHKHSENHNEDDEAQAADGGARDYSTAHAQWQVEVRVILFQLVLVEVRVYWRDRRIAHFFLLLFR